MRNLKFAWRLLCGTGILPVRALAVVAVVGWAFTASADISASAYVQNGLITHFDGRDNAGVGQHAASATEWRNLVATGGDLPLGNLADYSWGDNYLYVKTGSADGEKCLTMTNKVDFTGSFTIEFRGQSAGNVFRRWCIQPWVNSLESWSSSSEGFLERIGNTRLKVGTQTWNTEYSFVTTYDRTTKKHTFRRFDASGELLDCVSAVNSANFTTTPILTFLAKASSGGRCSSIRIYSRELSSDEIAWNSKIDNCRFSANPSLYRLSADGTDIECAVRAECDDGVGTIVVNGADVGIRCEQWFALGTENTVSVQAKPVAGWRFVRWTGDVDPALAGEPTLQLVIDRPHSLAPVFVRDGALSASSYVQNGLILLYDACENQGPGEGVDGATTLYDHIARTPLRLGADEACGATSFTLSTQHDLTGVFAARGISTVCDYTLQARVKPSELKSSSAVMPFVQAADRAGLCFEQRRVSGCCSVYTKYELQTTSQNRYYSYAANSLANYLDVVGPDCPAYTHTGLYEIGQRPSYAINGTMGAVRSYNSASGACVDSDVIRLGCANAPAAYGSIRVYSRRLTGPELLQNAAVDAIRFDGADPHEVALTGGYAFDSAMNLVSGVTVRILDGEGRGCGATTPACGYATLADGETLVCTATAGTNAVTGVRARPRGYTIEHYEPRNDTWSAPDTYLGDTCTIEQNGAEVVRVTWLWDRDVKIETTAVEGGQVDVDGEILPSGGHTWRTFGSQVRLRAVPDATHKFGGWAAGVSDDFSGLCAFSVEAKSVVSVEPSFVARGNARWIYDATAKTITHGESGVVLAVSASGSNLTLTKVTTDVGDMTIDFTDPVESSDGTAFSVTTLGTVFKGNANLRHLVLPPTVRAFSNNAFQGCPNLETVVMADGAVTMTTSMFQSCKNLRTIVLPRDLVTVGSSALRDCAALRHVSPQLPDSVRQVNGSALYGCTNLADTVLRLESVTNFGASAASDACFTRLKFGKENLITFGTLGHVKTLRQISPFFPSSMEYWDGEGGCWPTYPTSLTGECILSNPKGRVIEGETYRATAITGFDSSGAAGPETIAGGFFCYCYDLTNVTFGAALKKFSNGQNIFLSCAVDSLHFRGDCPEASIGLGATPSSVFAPYQNPTWRVPSEACVLSDMTATDGDNFRKRFRDVPVPEQKISFSGKVTAMPLLRWIERAPTKNDAYPIDLHLAVKYDTGAYPMTSKLFDGTGWTPSATLAKNEGWYGAVGDTAEFVLPWNAKTARGLKLNGYSLHQLAAGEYPNSRAPLKWRLEGRATDEDDWQVIDEVDLCEAGGATRWASQDDPTAYPLVGKTQTVPPRERTALSFAVPLEAQRAYVAYRFTPLESYNSLNVADDATPCALMEVRLYGEVVTPDPVLDGFVQSRSGWEDADFVVDVKNLGENAATGEHAETAFANVQVFADDSSEEPLAASGWKEVATGSNVFTVAGLAHASTYVARVTVTNALDGLTEMATSGQTLDEPFLCGGFEIGEDGSGNRTLSFTVEALYADSARIDYYYGESFDPARQTKRGTVTVSAAGTVVIDPQLPDGGTTPFVRVVVTATDEGEDYSHSYYSAAASFWVYDPDTSTLSNALTSVEFDVTASGTNLTLTATRNLPPSSAPDFTETMADLSGERYALVGVGTALKSQGNLISVVLPDSVTVIPANAFYGCAYLTSVTLPNTLRQINTAAFSECVRLTNVTPSLPDAVTNIAANAFQNCQAWQQPVRLKGIQRLTAGAFASAGITSLDVTDSPITYFGGGFELCRKLKVVKPLYPMTVTEFTMPSQWNNAAPVSGDLYIKNPAITRGIGGQEFRGWKLGTVDLYGSGIPTLGNWNFSTSATTNLILSETMNWIDGDNAVCEYGRYLRRLYVTGKPFETISNVTFNARALIVYLPHKYDEDWKAYIATNCEVRATDSEYRKTFHDTFPGEKCPYYMIKLPKANPRYNYLRWWPKSGFSVFVR